jgi:phosphoribosylformylglycinamidine (FGAM) synthase-like amidotransferase family enzyme
MKKLFKSEARGDFSLSFSGLLEEDDMIASFDYQGEPVVTVWLSDKVDPERILDAVASALPGSLRFGQKVNTSPPKG